MTIIGLDSLGMVILLVVLAVLIGYILVLGWNFEFAKGQFMFVVFFLLLLGMFIEAWFRETGDELLVGLAMFVMIGYLVVKWLLERRRRRWSRSRG